MGAEERRDLAITSHTRPQGKDESVLNPGTGEVCVRAHSGKRAEERAGVSTVQSKRPRGTGYVDRNVGQVLSTGARQVEMKGSLVHAGVWELAALAKGLADTLARQGGQQELAPRW